MNLREGRIAALQDIGAGRLFADARRGVEKESLRVCADGYIAQTPHPRALGAALTHRFITTDFSEALPEFVTPPLASSWEVLQFLCDLHQFSYAQLDDELLWAMSMPCMIRSAEDIPLANYGSSNVATMKTVYRRGLAYRYGHYMQAISGVHFNYSLPADFWPLYREVCGDSKSLQNFRSAGYFGLVRNVRRLDWLLLFLFGASPAVCKSFMNGRESNLDEFDSGTFYGRHATSLRMSDVGYQNKNQSRLQVSANSLNEYVADLSRAIRTPHADYAAIGLVVDGEYRQLNTNLLQIENEYYSTIRPKRVALSGERPTKALQRGGVEYVELRALDVSPFDPVGISQSRMKVLEAFLVYCLLADSPPADSAEYASNAANQLSVARNGRKPGLMLKQSNRDLPLREWGLDILQGMRAVCELIDCDDRQGYSQAVAEQELVMRDPSLTPSARLLDELSATRLPLFTYAMQLSQGHREYFEGLDPSLNQHWQTLNDETRESHARQLAIEAADTQDFETYLRTYFK